MEIGPGREISARPKTERFSMFWVLSRKQNYLNKSSQNQGKFNPFLCFRSKIHSLTLLNLVKSSSPQITLFGGVYNQK